MIKLEYNLKNLIRSIGFLFRPVMPVAVSFAFLVISFALLIFILFNLDESTKAYQVLLAILTGVTASLLIAIMMELYNNYRFNVRRQRELREFFRVVASYKISTDSIMKTNIKYASRLGSGRAYAVFCHLNKIIPSLREALNSREYLYKMEIDEIDDILYDYDYHLVKIIYMDLFGVFLNLIVDEGENGDEPKEEQKDLISPHEVVEESGTIDEAGLINESDNDYPALMEFLEKESKKYDKREKDSFFYDEAPAILESIIEKSIFVDRYIFNGYFEVIDSRYDSSKGMDDEKHIENYTRDKNRKFEFRSDTISKTCGDIDEAMIKLQKRATKEPYIWAIASYKEGY